MIDVYGGLEMKIKYAKMINVLNLNFFFQAKKPVQYEIGAYGFGKMTADRSFQHQN